MLQHQLQYTLFASNNLYCVSIQTPALQNLIFHSVCIYVFPNNPLQTNTSLALLHLLAKLLFLLVPFSPFLYFLQLSKNTQKYAQASNLLLFLHFPLNPQEFGLEEPTSNPHLYYQILPLVPIRRYFQNHYNYEFCQCF